MQASPFATTTRVIAAALVMLLSVLLIEAIDPPASAAATPVLPTSLSLTANKPAFEAGDSVELTATVDVPVEQSELELEIRDDADNSVVTTCSTGLT